MGYKCTFDKTIFRNEESGYSVISVKTADQTVPHQARSTYRHYDDLIHFTATGYGLPQTSAVELMLDGTWESKKHGCQLEVSHWEEVVPHSREGVRAYLASGLIKGIGDKTATAIVERFGADALDILDSQPDRLLEVRGITPSKLEEIKASYAESRVLRELMIYLAPFRITPRTALKIQEAFGPKSMEIIRKEPFALCRISGFGFKRVDAIARKTTYEPHAPMRIRGALLYILQECRGKEGHLYLETDVLCKRALALLNEEVAYPHTRLNIREVEEELYAAVTDKELRTSEGGIYLTNNFASEDAVARQVALSLMDTDPSLDISLELAQVVQALGISLSPKQASGVRMAFKYDLSIITGSPGTGKTTVLQVVIGVFRKLYPEKKIQLAAPTGRASRRMAESTGYANAKTLHKVLGLQAGDEDADGSGTGSIDADLLIIDEFSMVDMWLASKLFNSLRPGTKLLLVGDADQLPSVGAGNVLREFISCGLIPVTKLDQIFRQSADSLIAHNAKFINQNMTQLYYGNDFVLMECDTPPEAAALIQSIYLQEIAKCGVENVQMLSPFKSDGPASAEKLNEAIREVVNPAAPDKLEIKAGPRVFRVGDRVMQNKNVGSISNGDVGFIRNIRRSGNGSMLVSIEFTDGRCGEYGVDDLSIIELAYAMTIHKAMGSEYQTVIIPVLMAHQILLQRNLIYTAVTRAKKRVYLVGQKAALYMAIHKTKTDKRNTLLGQRIADYLAEFQRAEKSKPYYLPPEELKHTG